METNIFDRAYEGEKGESYQPDDDTRKFIEAVYTDFRQDAEVKTTGYAYLHGKSVVDYISECNKDFNALPESEESDDIIRQYTSSISRDKVNTEVAQIIANSPKPSIVAQNARQEVDRIVARVLRESLDYADNMDGMPSQNGKRKRLDYCIRMVAEGTVHIQEDMVDGECISTLVPNQEIYIPNIWQEDLQQQSHVLRVTNDVSYAEARLAFGHLDNFKYVSSGMYSDWNFADRTFFEEYANGVNIDDGHVQIIRAWYPISGKKKQKYFNILINGIPMYSWDNRMAYKHGFYPIAKDVFESFGNFYWGNSLSNKIREDKVFYEGWKTLLRAKQKFSVFPPLGAYGGLSVTENIFVPATVSPLGGTPDNLQRIPGIGEGLSSGDIEMMKMAEAEIDRGSFSPLLAGQQPSGDPTAREVATVSANAQINKGPTVDRFFNLEMSKEYLRVHNIVQYWPKKKFDGLSKITIPDAQLRTGERGALEILFEDIPPMDEEEMMIASEGLMQEQRQASKEKQPKEIAVIDKKYLRELSLFVTIQEKSQTDLEVSREIDFFTRTAGNPMFVQAEVARDLVRAYGKDEDRLIPKETPQVPQQPNQPNQSNQLSQSLGMETPAGKEMALPQGVTA